MSTKKNSFTPTRGMRNNNPLNIIRLDSNDWLGKITDSCATDAKFEQFRHPKYGFRAAFILLHRYINRGCNTVERIISRWAPASDMNDVPHYISMVCDYTGFTPETPIHNYKYSEMSALIEAMFFVENGVFMHSVPDKNYWYEALSDGYDLYVDRFVN